MTFSFWNSIKAAFIDNQFTLISGVIGNFTNRPFYMNIFAECSHIREIKVLRLGKRREQRLLKYAFYFKFLKERAKEKIKDILFDLESIFQFQKRMKLVDMLFRSVRVICTPKHLIWRKERDIEFEKLEGFEKSGIQAMIDLRKKKKSKRKICWVDDV